MYDLPWHWHQAASTSVADSWCVLSRNNNEFNNNNTSTLYNTYINDYQPKLFTV